MLSSKGWGLPGIWADEAFKASPQSVSLSEGKNLRYVNSIARSPYLLDSSQSWALQDVWAAALIAISYTGNTAKDNHPATLHYCMKMVCIALAGLQPRLALSLW